MAETYASEVHSPLYNDRVVVTSSRRFGPEHRVLIETETYDADRELWESYMPKWAPSMASLSVEEAKQLIKALQDAIEHVS